MKKNGWISVELMITTLVIFAILNIINYLSGWKLHPLLIMLLTLVLLFLMGISGELWEWLKKKCGRRSERDDDTGQS